jgi:hypothetical protein
MVSTTWSPTRYGSIDFNRNSTSPDLFITFLCHHLSRPFVRRSSTPCVAGLVAKSRWFPSLLHPRWLPGPETSGTVDTKSVLLAGLSYFHSEKSSILFSYSLQSRTVGDRRQARRSQRRLQTFLPFLLDAFVLLRYPPKHLALCCCMLAGEDKCPCLLPSLSLF